MGHDALAAADLAGAFGAGFDAAAAADAPGVGFDKAAAVDAPDVNFDKAATADPVEEPAVGFDAAAATDAPDVGSGLHVPVAVTAASASAAVSAPQASAAAFAAFAAFAAASVSEAHGPLLQVAESPNLAGSSSSESQREPASQSVFVKPGCLSRRTFRHTFHTLLGAAAFSRRGLRLGRRPNCCRSFSSRHSINVGGARCTCSRVGGGAFARDGHCARSHALMPMP